jgi:hypothetical protein
VPATTIPRLANVPVDGGRRQPQGSTGVRTAADREAICVAGVDPYPVGGNAQPFRGELGEAGGMALARGERADHDLDDAIRQHRHFGTFVRRAALRLDIAAETDAAMEGARPRLLQARRIAIPVGELQHPVECRLVVAAVVCDAE